MRSPRLMFDLKMIRMLLVRFEENELPENLEPLMTQTFPTERRSRAKEKEKADKAAGIVKVVKRWSQVVEQHVDDCGSSMQSIMFLDKEPLEVCEFAELQNPEVGMVRNMNIEASPEVVDAAPAALDTWRTMDAPFVTMLSTNFGFI